MIFVTVGGGPYYGFNRLVKKADEIAAGGKLEIVMQTGCSSYKPKNAKYFKFAHMEDMLDYYKKADAIVAHASGAPTIYARKFNLPLILVPRMAQLGEIFDDHQYKTAKQLEFEDMVEVVYDINDFEKAVEKSLMKKGRDWPVSRDRQNVIQCIKKFIEKI